MAKNASYTYAANLNEFGNVPKATDLAYDLTILSDPEQRLVEKLPATQFSASRAGLRTLRGMHAA